MLVQIQAPHFTAGLEVNKDKIVINAAPILKWTINKTLKQVIEYCEKKNYGWLCFSDNITSGTLRNKIVYNMTESSISDQQKKIMEFLEEFRNRANDLLIALKGT